MTDTSTAYRFTDPMDLPRIDLEGVASGAIGVFVLNEHGQTFDRIAPAFHDIPTKGSRFPELLTPYTGIVPAEFVVCKNNAKLIGYRTLLTAENELIQDRTFTNDAHRKGAIERMSMTDGFNNEDTLLRPVGDGEDFVETPNPRTHQHIAGTTVVLASTEPSNYGSFLFRILPKLGIVDQLNLKDFKILVPSYNPNMLALLQLAGLKTEQLVLQDVNIEYHMDRALMVSMQNEEAFLHQPTREFYKKFKSRIPHSQPHRRLYLTRRGMSAGATGRAMTNELEVATALESHGFEIMEPSRLSPREQIKLFASASVVVGQSGSALFNCVFMQPGTRLIDMESEPHWLHAHMCLFGSQGLRYGIFEAESLAPPGSPPHQPFVVDTDRLIARTIEFAY
ncbi:glycosyltransferase family 61 protein [Alcaligenaceae bacterium A4P071]|nr:glycosyltransferase family 61 protein [Alcaligenaceae bacterium B3P038]MDQ2148640.1 glycosyltransferase family 61 protein [Alcaligenaceae bacterium C4P045]MDQ2185966.1 glycosyltransferase family 61 protein [Alcaligenaceae bacterium A4P071]